MPDSVTRNTPVRIRWNELPGMLLHVREPRVMVHFPEKSIKVCEVAGVTAPVCCVRRLHDFGTKCRDVRQQRVYLGRGTHIVAREKPANPEPSGDAPASAARFSRGQRASQVLPSSKRVASLHNRKVSGAACLRPLRHVVGCLRNLHSAAISRHPPPSGKQPRALRG
jgi:hypothetical protein